jgi:hypothetical protein
VQVRLEGMNGIIDEAELMRLAKTPQRAALRRRLRKAHIPFFDTGGNIWTTVEALNATLVGREKNQKRGPNLDAITAKSSG